MRHSHLRKQARADVARTLVAGLSGIHPDKIGRWVLMVDNTDCGVHVTSNACCAYDALLGVGIIAESELEHQVPCSGERR